MRGRNEHMIEPPSEDDKRHAAANYLHFEHEDPGVWDIYFDSFEEAVEFVNDRGWGFASEDWEPMVPSSGSSSCSSPNSPNEQS
jgi:hypothetical protein